jgi:hypothetical protein
MKSIKNRVKRLVCSALTLCFVYGASVVNAAEVSQQLDYTDSLDSFDNPDRGFYSPVCFHLKKSGGTAMNPTANLVHLRVDISEFSSNAVLSGSGDNKVYGESAPISDEALKNLSDTLENIRKRGHSVIVRVCYDKNYGGEKNCEPEQEMILTHLQQLGAVYTEYADVISYVELGMYGPWGEMHTSDCCTTDNVTQALNTLLDATPDTIKIGVRTPNYVAAWLGINTSDFDVNSEVFKAAFADKGKAAYRVGMYNDGYLGSSSDLGTYGKVTREKGVEWLNELARYTLYGGECVRDVNYSKTGNVIGEYNTIDYISKEGFQTHTSYLNSSWNDVVISKWKNEETYTGEDEYNGQTAFKYISDHLGYRLVMRDSVLPVAVKAGATLPLDVKLENVGFGNIVNSERLTVVLKNANGDVVELTPKDDVNPCDFLSREVSEVKTSVDLPELKKGSWNVYLRLSKYGDLNTDGNYHCIRFGNSADYWDSAVGANYVGSVTVVENGEKNKADVAAVLKLISGAMSEEDFSKRYDLDAADTNGDGVVNLADVIALINVM